MKRMKRLATCCLAVACAAALLVSLSGCSSKEAYTPPDKTPTLSSPTIGKDGTLRVGVNADSAPLAGQLSDSGKIVGVDVDVAAALADSFGLKLEVVDVGADLEGALSDGRVDIVMGVDKSDTDAAFWKSEAYLPTAVALFSAEPNAEVPTNDSEPSVAAQISSKSAWAVTNEFDQGTITTTDNLKNAFSELESGQVQYVAADAVIGTYAAHNAGDDVHIVALMQQPSGYSVGVLDSNTDLKTAVSDALASLTGNGVISVIETKWLGGPLDLSATPLTEGASAASTGSEDDGESEVLGGEGGDVGTGEATGDEGDGSEPSSEAGGNAVQPEDVALL
ncbi:ABC transporter substrate-binding protein [Gordonibacter sp. An230]|uniref:substrate-binding periplasmic protein n=1 Tax=Gordonibacter sp. An230 TaxID=1965592 RepID=UPI000B3AF3D8|nr:transporter substrate-binding domain-containing protein [Gordonibacter sp. An230]OUO90903.1 ABC transporter substrate-binding protein [Gordonibacter sp. An230]